MSVAYTSDELGRVSKAQAETVKYYSASAGALTEASDDFKGYLALAAPATKTAVVNWFTASAAVLAADVGFNALYQQVCAAQESDVTSLLTQVDLLFSQFDDFKSAFPGDVRFNDVTEIGLILADADLVAAQQIELRDRMTHRKRLLASHQIRYGSGGVAESRKRQAMSWAIPLSKPIGV